MSKEKESLMAVRNHVAGTAVLDKNELSTNIAKDLQEEMQKLDSLRKGGKDVKPVDITFGDYVKERWNYAPTEKTNAPDAFYRALGVDPCRDTVESLLTLPEFNNAYRWLVPEIFREAIRLGMRKAPIYPNIIISDESVSQLQVTMPQIEMSDAMPKKIQEAETIPVGDVKFGQKTVKLFKVGTGIEVPDEVLQYVSLNVVSLYLQDIGIKMGGALDKLAIQTLINGDQADGSESAPLIGVRDTAGNVFAYKDFLGAWIRMSRIGRPVGGFIAGENAALEILELPEFKALPGTATLKSIVLKTPIPSSQNFWIHGVMPANQVMLLDTDAALLKLTSQALRVETDRIVNKQINGSYVTLTTGFANVFRDARLLIDKTVDFTSFPSWMDIDAVQNEAFLES